MKLPTILYVLLVFFNILCLVYIIALLVHEGADELLINVPGRIAFYLFYITALFNLYGLFYIAVKKRFND